MKTPRDLFQHELLDMLDAEQRLVKALPKMAQNTSDEKLRAGLEQHAEQTQGHVQRIEQCLQTLGIKPEKVTCAGMAGLIKEYEQFAKEQPSEQVMTLFLLGAADKTEHYEIVGYRDLVDMATNLGENEVAGTLSQTLKEEEHMAKEIEKLQKSVGKELETASQ